MENSTVHYGKKYHTGMENRRTAHIMARILDWKSANADPGSTVAVVHIASDNVILTSVQGKCTYATT